MEYLLEIIVAIIGAIVAGALTWGISRIKEYLDLDPNGEIMESMEMWQGKIVRWIMNEAAEYGADLNVPETRWKVVNEAIEYFIGKIPRIIDFLGYSKQDLAKEVEQLVREQLNRIES